MRDDEFKIQHEGSKQHLRFGRTKGGRNLFIEFRTRSGEEGSEYRTKTETGELISFLQDQHGKLDENK